MNIVIPKEDLATAARGQSVALRSPRCRERPLAGQLLGCLQLPLATRLPQHELEPIT